MPQFYTGMSGPTAIVKLNDLYDLATANSGVLISGMQDVVITTPTDGQALVYDSVTSKWVNETVAGGGSGTTTNTHTIKFNTGTTEGTDLYTFNGSSAKSINFVPGTNVSFSYASNTVTINVNDTSVNWSEIQSKPTTISGYGISDAQPLDGDLTAIAALAGTTGFLKKTAANTWTLDTNTYLTGNQSISFSGAATGSGTTSVALTLATVPVNKGGTNLTTIPAKSVLIANSLDTVTTIVPGNGQSIRMNAGGTAWEAFTPAAGGTGDVLGQASSIANELPLFGDNSGKLISRSTGTGFVKVTSGLVSYDNSTYLTTTGNGSGLTNLNASNLATGTVGTARLGSGTANSTTFLRGDGTWAATGGGGTTTNAYILKFDTGTTEGTDLYTFNGSAAKTIDIKAGTSISISKAAGSVTIGVAGHTHTLSQISDWPVAISTTELGYLDGVTSSIQTQLGGKQASLGFTPENSTNKGVASGYASLDTNTRVPTAQLGTGTANSTTYLRGDGSWQAIAAGGDASTNTATSVDGEVVLFSDTGGKTLKRATGSGLAKLTSGVLSTATAGTDYVAPNVTSTFTATQNFSSSGITLKGSSTGFTTFASANASVTNYTATYPAANTSIPIIGQTITISGPTAARTYTFPDANATLLSTNVTVTVAQGGTGVSTLTGIVKGNGTGAFSAATANSDYLPVNNPSATGQVLCSSSRNGASWGGAQFQAYTNPGSTTDFSSIAYHVQDVSNAPQWGFYAGDNNRFGLYNSDGTARIFTFPVGGVSNGILKITSGDISAATAGTDYAKPDTASSWTAEQTFKEVKDTVFTITDAAGFSIDPANGSVQIVTIAAGRTPVATNFEAGQTVLLGIQGNYAITWTSVNPTWIKAGGTAAAPSAAASGYLWVLLWKVGSTMYMSEVGKV